MAFLFGSLSRWLGREPGADSQRGVRPHRGRAAPAPLELIYSKGLAGHLVDSQTSIDLYRTSLPEPRGVVFFLHGGGLSSGDKRHVGVKPGFFTDSGYHFVSANYPLASATSDVSLDLQLEAVSALSSWIVDQLGSYCLLPPGSDLVASGHSAGAYLLALAVAKGLLAAEISKCILIDSASYDLVARYRSARPPVRQEMKRLVGAQGLAERELTTHLERYSPAHLLLSRQGDLPSARSSLDVLLCTTLKQGSLRSAAALAHSLRLRQGWSATHKSYRLEHTMINRAVGMPNQPISRDVLTFLNS